MKKTVALLSVLALLCSVLVGCSGGEESSSSEQEETGVLAVIQSLQDADLPIPYYIVYTEENDPNGDDNDYVEKGNFVDERVEAEYSKEQPESGSVEIFETPEDAEKRAEYLQGFSVLDSLQYQLVRDNVLLRLNNALTEEQVSEYAKAFGGELVAQPSDADHHQAYCYGERFNIHAGQLKDGMALTEASEIMGFQPETSGDTCVWFDEYSSSTVSAMLEDNVLKQVVFLNPDAEDAEDSEDEEKEEEESEASEEPESSEPDDEEEPVKDKEPAKDEGSSVTTSQKNALEKANDYLRFSAFSREGLIGQLEYEEFSYEDAVYAVDHCGADWNEQALEKAESYLKFSAFSASGLQEQLEFEKFTKEQASYGVKNCGADWMEQAVKKAESYLKYSSFSRDGLIDQLEFEGFTHEQAVYGAEQNGL